MALPTITSLADCTNLQNTVLQYQPQFLALWPKLLESWNSFEQLKVVYLDTNPVVFAFAASLIFSPIFFILSEFNRNYSQVDRAWSILPTFYNAHYALWATLNGLPTERVYTVLAASTIWSMRLTYNYFRKGGYTKGSEDYRWAILRKYINPVLFVVFDAVFISIAQNILLFLITTPTYVLLLSSLVKDNSFNTSDIVFASLIVAVIAVEYAADQAQWNFHLAKDLYKQTARVPQGYTQADMERGFLARGMWAYSRHPNFAAEQSVWLLLYQWSCPATETPYNWSFIGAVAYLALFQASTWFTELVTAGKYAQYAEYQEKVGMFVPRIGTEPLSDPMKYRGKTPKKVLKKA